MPDVPPDPFPDGAAAVPAATVVALRGRRALETLLLRRAGGLSFAGGMWVWPGGRLDPEDRRDAADLETAARRAAVREAAEEAGLVLDPSELTWFSHWTPPSVNPKRFRTFFFATRVDDAAAVTVDGGENLEHRWLTPEAALAAHAAGTLGLTPPTFITLAHLARWHDVDEAMAALTAAAPEFFATRFTTVPGGAVALYHGDIAYLDDEPDPDQDGPRHRLWMVEDGWRYERSRS